MSVERRGSSGYTARVRDRIYDHVFAHPGAEVGGVLVGKKFEDGTQVIRGSVRAEAARGDLTSLTFTHDTWDQIHAEIERDHAGDDIVGWYHSHPGHGIFLSNHDTFIHQNFFADAACLALVIDPLNGEEGMFGWQGQELQCFWHQVTSREPVAGVAPPPLIDRQAAATPAAVEFEKEPTYDHEIVDLGTMEQPGPQYEEQLYAEQQQYVEEERFYEEPPVVARPVIDERDFERFDAPPQMVTRAEGTYSVGAYAIPVAGGAFVGTLLAIILRGAF